MMKLELFTIFLIALFIQQSSCVQKILGVIPERASLYDPSKPFTCLDGSNTIPFEQVNDDYCDCRDASDEPGTAACLNGQFACENIGYIVQMIPSGRVGDGICDCCDGSDEINSEGISCPNECATLAVEMRAEEEKIKLLTEQGLAKKKALIEQGNILRQSMQTSIDSLQAERAHLETEKTRLETLKAEAESKANTAKAAQDLIFEEKKAELKKVQAAKKAQDLFRSLDLNKDSFLTPEELLHHSELDILFDNDGQFTLEESTKLLDDNQQVTSEVFVATYYEKVSPHLIQYDENKSTVAPGEDEENLEASENEHDDMHDDEEEVPEIKAEHEVEELAIKYDDETQRLIDESNEARKQFDEANRRYLDSDREIKEKEAQLTYDVGPENEFASMINQCYEYSDREYTYKLCPFSKTIQHSKSNNGDTSIGSWGHWNTDASKKYTTMHFENGLSCWNGPQRSTVVHLVCGLDNKVVSVAEPNKCEYEMKFETPAVCNEVFLASHEHEEL